MNKFAAFFRAIALFLLIFLCVPCPSFSQPGGGEDCHTYQDPQLDCPIDNGLVILLAIGVGYGIIKYKESTRSIKLPSTNDLPID